MVFNSIDDDVLSDYVRELRRGILALLKPPCSLKRLADLVDLIERLDNFEEHDEETGTIRRDTVSSGTRRQKRKGR